MSAIYAALAAVASEIAQVGVGKDRENKDQKYKFRGVDDMYNALAPILARNKVVVVPNVVDHTMEQYTTTSGKGMWRSIADVEYNFYSGEDGSCVRARVIGEGADSGDKSLNKALSAAYKYAMMQTFCIPVEGQSIDSETETPPSPQVRSPEQRKAERKAETPEETAARQSGHHPDWDKNKGWFFGELTKLGIEYDTLCAYLEWAKQAKDFGSGRRPSEMDKASLNKLLVFLGSPKSEQLFGEYLATHTGLPDGDSTVIPF